MTPPLRKAVHPLRLTSLGGRAIPIRSRPSSSGRRRCAKNYKERIMNKMLDRDSLKHLENEVADWQTNEVAAFLKKQAERKHEFFTTGDIPVKRVYTAADIADTPIEDIGLPGRYPFTRGPYPTMYRS